MSEAQYYTQPATKADLEQAQAIVRFIQPLLVTAGSGMGHGLQEARDLDGYLRDRLAVADVRLRPDYGRAFRNSSQYHRVRPLDFAKSILLADIWCIAVPVSM